MKKIIITIFTVAISILCMVSVFAEETQPAITTIDKRTKVSEFIEKPEYSSFIITDINGEQLDSDAYIPNGAYIVNMNDEAVTQKTQICFLYDVNCDARITAADARLALRCSAKLENLEGIQFISADINNDKKITAADARLLLRFQGKI